MALIKFFEKPGCGNNARQSALLRASGHALEMHNLLSEPWTAETLRPFFGAKPVAEWFNKAAPRVKSGEVQPEALSEAQALAMMVADPLLIRRPLMQVGEARVAGFDQDGVAAWIGLAETGRRVDEACLKTGDAPPCPAPPCPEPVA